MCIAARSIWRRWQTSYASHCSEPLLSQDIWWTRTSRHPRFEVFNCISPSKSGLSSKRVICTCSTLHALSTVKLINVCGNTELNHYRPHPFKSTIKTATFFVVVPGKEPLSFRAELSVKIVEEKVGEVHMLVGGGLREGEDGHLMVEGDRCAAGTDYFFVGGIAGGKWCHQLNKSMSMFKMMSLVCCQFPNNILRQPKSQLNLRKLVSLHYVWAL